MSQTVASTGPRWSDLTADEICSELRKLRKQVAQMKKSGASWSHHCSGRNCISGNTQGISRRHRNGENQTLSVSQKRAVFYNPKQELPDHK